MSIFSYICWPFLFLGKSIYSSRLPIFTLDFFVAVELCKFFMYIGYSPVSEMVCKYLLPFGQLSFCFVDGLLCCAGALQFDIVPVIYFCFYSPCLWGQIYEVLSETKVSKFRTMFSSVYLSQVLYLHLCSILSYFLCMVLNSSLVLFFYVWLSNFPSTIY